MRLQEQGKTEQARKDLDRKQEYIFCSQLFLSTFPNLLIDYLVLFVCVQIVWL